MARIPKRGPMPKNLRLAPEVETGPSAVPTGTGTSEALDPVPSGEPLDCPDTCRSKKDLWNDVSAGLTPKDIPLLEAAFLARDRLAAAQRAFNEDGPVILNIKGESVPNPAARIAEQATASLLRACDQLGLSPASRARILRGTMTEEKEETPEEIMFGGGDE